MTIHFVKSWPYLFEAAVSGNKKHDFRDLDERDYKVGDCLMLQEFDQVKGAYTGREHLFKITYITSHNTPCAFSSGALRRGIGVLSIERQERVGGIFMPVETCDS